MIEHDRGGNELGQLSLLDLATDGLPEPVELVHDPAYLHWLIDANATRVLFSTNRRNGTGFDLVARDLETGADTVLYESSSYLATVTASPDDRWVTILVANGPGNSYQLLLVDATSKSVTELTAADAANYQDSVMCRRTRSGRPTVATP